MSVSELDEITGGKDINQLHHELAFQLNQGEPIAGIICSHITDVLNRLMYTKYIKRHWKSTITTPEQNTEVVLHYGNGLMVSGRYHEGVFKQYGSLQTDEEGIIKKPTHWTELILF